MSANVWKFLPEAIEALVAIFKTLRTGRDAQSLVAHLRSLGDSYRADIDTIKRGAIARSRARHTDGTGDSD